LSGHLRDEVKIGVVVEHDEPLVLGSGSNEQVRHLAAPQVAGRQQALNMTGSPQVDVRRFDQGEDSDGFDQSIPFSLVAGREADLEISDPRSGGRAVGQV